MTEQEQQEQTFDAEYVKSLREEAKRYRQELKDLKVQHTKTQIQNELNARGIKADPDWVKLKEGQTPTEAVEQFIESHSDILKVPEADDVENIQKNAPKSLPKNQSNVNSPGPKPHGKFGGRSLDEIEQDPNARANLGDLYRSLLAQSSNQN